MHATTGSRARRRLTGIAGMVSALLFVIASPAIAQTATGTIIGRVTDVRLSTPIAQTTIEIEGTRLGAVTDQEGRYRIGNVPAGSRALVARRIGYGSRRRTVTVSAGTEATADFALDAAAVSLDEIVVTGTAGGEMRRSIGNAVNRVEASDELAKAAATNFTSLINARVPGLSVGNTTGRLGATPSIQIRGRSSISLGNSPLFYIDGVRVNSSTGIGPVAVSGGLGGQASQVGGRLNDLNPDDIESIEVINGPAAATIYGTEAANGVIQIITKRGRAANTPQIAFRTEIGSLYFRDAAGRVQTNYARDRNGAIIAWNGVQQETDSGRALFKTGLTRQYNGSASGGFEALRYYVSGGYENDYGIEPNNALRQFTTHTNLSSPVGKNSDATVSLNFVNLSAHLGADVGASALLGAQVGHIVTNPGSRGFYPGFPPEVPQQLYDNATGINRFTGSLTVNNRPTGWFSQRAIVGLDYTGEDARAIERFAPPELSSFLSAAAAGGRIGQTLRHSTFISADYAGSARFNLTSALVSTTSLGGQFYNNEANSSFLGGSGFPAPGVETVTATSVPAAANQTQTINTTIGAYGQQQFGWRDRLFITAALRVDNNSAFGQDFKWVTYPKVSASWVVNEEPFWHWSSINTLRLRAAYGESGRQPAAFSALRTFTPVTGANGASGVTPGTIGNPNLKPERGKELELGVETGMFGRLTLDMTYFNKRTFDEIVSQPVAPSSGFPGSQFANLGRVDNKGFEAQATFQAIRRRSLTWEIAGNIGTNKDEIRDLGGLPSIISAYGGANKVGYPIQGIFSKKVASAERNPTTGLATNVLCVDTLPGSATTACATAPFIYLGTPTPRTTGAIGNTVTIRNRLRLYALVDFKRGHKVVNNVDVLRCTGAVGTPYCRSNYYPSEFSPTYLAANTLTALTQNYMDQYYQDGSFTKLREVSATYTFPERWLRGVNGASFTLAARELHTWTKYTGIDPEGYVGTSDQAVTPPLNRIIGTFNLRW